MLLEKLLGNARLLSHDVLHTILVEMKGAVYGRRLIFVVSELEGEILTAAHLLSGRNINSLPDYPVQEEVSRKGLRSQEKYLIERLVHFWSRQKNEYL